MDSSFFLKAGFKARPASGSPRISTTLCSMNCSNSSTVISLILAIERLRKFPGHFTNYDLIEIKGQADVQVQGLKPLASCLGPISDTFPGSVIRYSPDPAAAP